MVLSILCTHTHPGEQQRGNSSDKVNVEMVKREAYEVVQLSKQRVTMNDNPAYGELGVGEYTVIVIKNETRTLYL